ncbi:MAG TPA: hypothetical protein VIK02_06200 [Candidatus Anoxymicrobiaceae bacterium]
MGLIVEGVASLASDGTNLYAGCENGHVYRHAQDTSWTDIGLVEEDARVTTLVFAGKELYAACTDFPGPLYSYEGGTSWSWNDLDPRPDITVWVTALAWIDGDLYAGGEDGCVYRQKVGVGWDRITSKIPELHGGSLTISTIALVGTDLFAGVSESYIYRYRDGKWTEVGGMWGDVEKLIWTGTDLYANRGGDIDRYDGGKRWSDVYLPSDAQTLVPDGTGLLAGSVDGLVYRYDGASWTEIGGKKETPEVDALASVGGRLYTGGKDGVYQMPLTYRTFFNYSYGSDVDQYLCLSNNEQVESTATVEYSLADGNTVNAEYRVPGGSQYTIRMNDILTSASCVSAIVRSDATGIVAEMPVYFGDKRSAGCSVGNSVGSSCKRWYFAEGTTLPGYEEYIVVWYPQSSEDPADLTFHYMGEGEELGEFTRSVYSGTTTAFKTRDQIGSNQNVSLYLESSENIMAKRIMYFDYRGSSQADWTGQHEIAGANSPDREWYFAEGTTRNNGTDGSFDQWLCLQNPGRKPITVKATYQLASGQGKPVTKSYTVNAMRRLTVSVNREIGKNKDSSIHLSSTSPFVAERSQYFDYHRAITGGDVALGTAGPAKAWSFAAGTTVQGHDEWLCLQNPGKRDSAVTITYRTSSALKIEKNWTVPAGRRLTVNVNSDAGSGLDLATTVVSEMPIVVERAMYFDHDGMRGGDSVHGVVPD